MRRGGGPAHGGVVRPERTLILTLQGLDRTGTVGVGEGVEIGRVIMAGPPGRGTFPATTTGRPPGRFAERREGIMMREREEPTR